MGKKVRILKEISDYHQIGDVLDYKDIMFDEHEGILLHKVLPDYMVIEALIRKKYLEWVEGRGEK